MLNKYKDIEYSFKTSNRKTLSIYIERNQKISVLAPDFLNQKDIDKILELKRYWIYKSLAELKDLNKSKVKRTVLDGEGFLYLGKNYKLKIKQNLKEPLSVEGSYFLLDIRNIKNPKKYFINFYKMEGNLILKRRIEYFKKKIGVTPKSFNIMNLQNRWASSNKKNLKFHWKIFMAPQSIIDYIIVHELVHLKVPNHSKEFWELVESIMPDFYDRKNWLKYNGANLEI